MTLKSLREDLARITAHPLTETNIDGIIQTPLGIFFDTDARDTALTEAKEVKEERDDLEKQLKESESENEQLTREITKLDEKLDASFANDPRTLADALEDVERFRQRAADWARAYEDMEKELTALRKRKGVSANLITHTREIMDLLRDLSYKNPKAKDILEKINSRF